jgi:hypothetical protein
MQYEHKAPESVRGRVRQKGGSDPLFSPGLRPEKRQGVAPALFNSAMLFVVALVGWALPPANRKQYSATNSSIPENYSSGEAGIFSLWDFTDFLPISMSGGVLRRTVLSLFRAIPHGKPSVQGVRHALA